MTELQQTLFHDALTLHKNGEWEQAYRQYNELIDSGLESADLYSNLANICNMRLQFEEAIEWGEKAAGLDPAHINAKGNLISAYRESAYYDKALALLGEMLKLEPSPRIVHNIAKVLKDNREVDKAVNLLVQLLTEHQKFMEAYFTLSECLLLKRDWRRGWHHYQSRLMLPERIYAFKDIPKPLWDGQTYNDKSILVFWEQGFGDTVLFARYVELLKPKFKSVHFLVQPPLVELMRNSLEGIGIVDTNDLKEKNQVLDFDFYVPLLSLPMLLPDHLPETIGKNYLKAFDFPLPEAEKMDAKKVGISWKTGTSTPYGRFKSIPLALFLEKLDSLKDAQLYALQLGIDPEEAEILESHQVIRLDGEMQDFQKSADLVNQMDFIVSIDTALAHVSGALGKKTIVLPAFSPAWVWGLEEKQSIWYEDVKLVSQHQPREWESTLVEVDDMCRKWL